jgi:hypothetical protein
MARKTWRLADALLLLPVLKDSSAAGAESRPLVANSRAHPVRPHHLDAHGPAPFGHRQQLTARHAPAAGERIAL